MQTHVPSNLATYQTVTGHPLFDTFFVLLDEKPLAFISPDMRAKAIQAAAKRGDDCRALSHKEAFEMLRGGRVAFFYGIGLTWEEMEVASSYKVSPRIVATGIRAE